jgi:hypothetical protein
MIEIKKPLIPKSKKIGCKDERSKNKPHAVPPCFRNKKTPIKVPACLSSVILIYQDEGGLPSSTLVLPDID